MRVLVLSDIHANLTALEAVLEDAGSFDAAWCLGDLVGYGPDPNECVSRVHALPELVCLIGNHDQAALGGIPLSRFNRDARDVAEWTRSVLSPENQEYLRSLPARINTQDFTLAHGSPRQPVWEYILDQYTADRMFDFFDTPFCLVGHSHLPLVFKRGSDGAFATPVATRLGKSIPMAPRMILNPGSVGQPRDMDPRAAYALLDLEARTWDARRVRYDVAQVQLRILEAGLPERQALRLVAGW
jgi:diadenosine tetraphosphatase ApaH/serine/threonine PP2A family protein phosphatase